MYLRLPHKKNKIGYKDTAKNSHTQIFSLLFANKTKKKAQIVRKITVSA
jgi:hypothetical protein